jgi:hypothetical protein
MLAHAPIGLRKNLPCAYTYERRLGRIRDRLRELQENGDKQQRLRCVRSDLMARLDARKPQQPHASSSQEL